jgi:hypothetical protein
MAMSGKMIVEIKAGESLRLEGNGVSVVTLEHKSGQRARLRVEADEGVYINLPDSQYEPDLIISGLLVRRH